MVYASTLFVRVKEKSDKFAANSSNGFRTERKECRTDQRCT